MRGEARVKAAQPTTDNPCWGLTEAGSAGDFCAHCQRFLPSITTTGASAASNPSNRRALTPMRRVLPSHFPSASNAGLSLNVVQPQWAQKRCATCRVCHHQVWRTARVLAGIGSLRPHLTAPEVADHAIPAGKDAETWYVRILGADTVSGAVTAALGANFDVPPAALLLERYEPLNR